MRVLHIISGDLWAGAEVQALTLISALREQPNIQVAVALMNDGELANRLRMKDIPVTIIREDQLNPLQIFSELRKLMRAWSPDVVHTHRIKENILGSIANRCTQNAPSIRTTHGAEEHPPRGIGQLHKLLLRMANQFCGHYLQEKIIAVSSDLRDKLATDFSSEKIVVVENGVDISGIRAQVHPVDFRTRSPHATHIGIVGRLVPVKRIDLFLETAVLLRKQNPERDWRFHVIGEGPLMASHQLTARQLDLEGCTTFHGHVHDVISHIAALDAMVMCSDHEGMPMALLEALCVGTPVVGHNVGGIRSVLCDGVGGVAVANHDAVGYAQGVVNALMQDRAIAQVAALKRITEQYSAQRNAERIVAVYQEAIYSSKRSRAATT